MPLTLLSSKLYIPPARDNAVARPRLTEKLLSGLLPPGHFALLSGPAGFGKTTLLSEFAARLQQPAVWVSLDEGDNDPIRFWSYLVAACQSAWPGAGDSALALFQSPYPLPDEAIPTILINDLAGLDRDLVLVLDDYHTIQNPSVHASFGFLLEHLPAKLHVVVSTRVDPPWPLARFRARNQLVEVRAQDLRFTPEEAASFLNRVMGLDLATGDVAALEERTEGWVAALQLAALSMKGRGDMTSFVKAFTGSHVYIAEYLVEEVLQRQPEEIQAFLMQTSILERLNAGLCEAVTGGENGQLMLAALHRGNLFVVPLDDEGQWFRYHHLFSDLLQARLRQNLPAGAIASLHQRASAWYEQSGMTSEAFEHALAAADYLHVVELVEKTALPLILQGYVRTVDGWLQVIPKEFLAKRPKVNLAFAWLNLLRGTFTQAAPFLERLRTISATPDAENNDPSFLGEWLAIQSKLLLAQGKPAESRDLANRALQILPEADALVRRLVYVNLAMAYEQMLDYDHAAETFQTIVRDAREMGDDTFEILGISGHARMELMQGRLHRSFEIATEGINRLEASGRKTPFSATLYGELSQIHYQWHQLDQARMYSQRSIQASGQVGYSDPEIYDNILLARIYQMDGDWEASAREMQKANALAGAVPPAMIRENIISQQVRVDLAFGRIEAAQERLKADGFTFDGVFGFPDLAPGSNVTDPAGLLYNSALRVLLSQVRTSHNLLNLKRGLELATQVLAGELQCRQIPVALETLLLRSQMHAVLGDERNSLADVSQALELGELEGFISVFIEGGEEIRLKIVDCRLMIEKSGNERLLGYISRVLDTFGKPPAFRDRQAITNQQSKIINQQSTISNLIEPLTLRELEVLRLIAAGDSNQEIAEKLVITVSAIKKHTSNIYGKLNANSRTQAVARARQLRLLPAGD